MLSPRSLTPIRASALALILLGATSARAAAPPGPPTVTPAPPPPVAGTPAAGTPPAAPGPSDPEVDEHVAQGHRQYQLGRYQEAIAEYRRAYELRADPAFLFEIAEAYRQLGATEQALFYYDRYLAAAPEAPNHAAAEERVLEIESLRARPPASPLTPGLGSDTVATVAKKRSPLWRRWWVWTAVGVALAAGVTAAALSARSSEAPAPTTDLGAKTFF